MVQALTRMAAPGAWVPVWHVASPAALDATGVTRDATRDALRSLAAQGRLELDESGERLRILPAEDGRGAPAGGAGAEDVVFRAVVLLSLFDGVGTARVALDDFLSRAGLGGKLEGSFFAEWDGQLAQAVERLWADRVANDGVVMHTKVAGDVWDLLRHDMAALRRVLRAARPGALLLIVGGSPCQQLTVAGPSRGRHGLAGPDSRHFFAFPAVAWAAQWLRPDLRVHVMVENAGTTRGEHLQVMCHSLGLDPTPAVAPRIDAGEWTSFERARVFPSTLPHFALPEQRRDPRPAPWDAGWAMRFPGKMAVMTTAIGDDGGGGLRTSTFQYAPRYLLYQRSVWDGTADSRLAAAVEAAMPDETRPGWRVLRMGHLRADQESDAVPAARWIADRGLTIGIRTPNTVERARAMGLEGYYGRLAAAGLDDRAIFSAQGNAFDHVAVDRRIGAAVVAWLRGGDLPPHIYPGPAVVERLYQEVRGPIATGSDGGAPLRCADSAFPEDLHGLLLHRRGDANGGQTAAVTGRPAQ